MMSTVIPHEARAVYYSKGGAAMKDRVSKTAELGYDVMTRNAFAPDGEMIVTCVHAAVRHLLPRSPQWSGSAELRIPREPVWDTLLDVAWGPFIAVREGLLPFPLAPAEYWTFDEFLRQAALLFLSEGKPISIEIPDVNRPS
jgi:hypothetical protein